MQSLSLSLTETPTAGPTPGYQGHAVLMLLNASIQIVPHISLTKQGSKKYVLINTTWQQSIAPAACTQGPDTTSPVSFPMPVAGSLGSLVEVGVCADCSKAETTAAGVKGEGEGNCLCNSCQMLVLDVLLEVGCCPGASFGCTYTQKCCLLYTSPSPRD